MQPVSPFSLRIKPHLTNEKSLPLHSVVNHKQLVQLSNFSGDPVAQP